VELAWCWLQWQPDSELSRWYDRRFAAGNARTRKIGIVALARKLLIALWRHLEKDEAPPGSKRCDWQAKVGIKKRAEAAA
jgi:transposase